MSRSVRSLGVVSAALLLFGLAGCGSDNTPAATDGGKIKAVASTNVWGSVLSAVGGDQVEVTSILNDPSADPHSYETTSTDVVAIEEAQLALSNGGGYDDFFTSLTDQAPNADKLVAYDIAKEAGAAGENEHVWYSFTAVQTVADHVATELGKLKPEAAATFTANATDFKQKVEALATRTAEIGSAHPGTKVLATEPVAYYLLEAAKLTDATPEDFSEAIENETDVPPAALAEVDQLIANREIQLVVNNAQTETPVTTQVVDRAKQAGLPVVDVTETLPPQTPDYIAWMSGEVDALSGALNR